MTCTVVISGYDPLDVVCEPSKDNPLTQEVAVIKN